MHLGDVAGINNGSGKDDFFIDGADEVAFVLLFAILTAPDNAEDFPIADDSDEACVAIDDVAIDDVIDILNNKSSPKFQYLTPDFNRSYFKYKTFVFSNDNDT